MSRIEKNNNSEKKIFGLALLIILLIITFSILVSYEKIKINFG